jgi:hypothetical protein
MLVFLRNSANSFRLAFFFRIAEDRFSVAWWQVAAFALASLFVPVLYDFALVGRNGQVEWYAIPSAMVHFPVILFAAIAVAYAHGRGEKTLLLLQSFLMINAATDLVVYTAYGAAAVLYPISWLYEVLDEYYLLQPIWLAAACARATSVLLSVSLRQRVIAYATCMVLLAVPLRQLYRERSLWQEVTQDDDSDSNGPYRALTQEDVFYRQANVLESELAGVRPGQRGVIDVYFIGMGGYAYQDVFMKEVDAVSHLFRERFGTEGETIRLVNNPSSVDRSPIASVTSLRASLKRVADVMDRNEDILFLFLTSHGSETHRFSIEFWPLQFHELDPSKLRALLDESAIKNRVVVVSACFAGGFINALRDENTLIIAAAAPDKNSFGCSNEAEWTYFGKAYFDEALRETYSFVEAFEIAKPVIAAREKKEGYKPSDPQMALGKGMQVKLFTLQRQLAAQDKNLLDGSR